MHSNFLWKLRLNARCVLVLFLKKKEQAEVGRSPTLLALRFAAGVLRILRGYFKRFLTAY
jgi:hypothetical protein